MATQKRFIAKNGLDNNTQTITNVADPSSIQDAATKNYISSNFIGTSSSAYPTVQPSLNLDFANSKQLDPRITFVRNSTAAYYDGQTSALAEQNLLLQSQAFGTTPWIFAGESLTTTELAPDGTSTASLMTCVGQYHSVRTNISGLVVGTTYTVSLWVKSNVGTNAYTIWLDGSSTSIGTITPTSTWTRYSFSFVYPSGALTFNLLQDRNASGFGSVYLWGAQLEQRSSVTAYTPTTTAAITNYIPVLMTAPAGVARFDYDPITGKSLGLLIEESRTNLITYSQDFNTSTNWLLIRASKIANCIVAPDGTLTGTKLIGNTTANTSHWISDYSNRTVNAGSSYTFSVYAKAGEYNYIALYPNVSNATTLGYPTFFNLTTGAVSQVTNTNSSINVTFLTSSVNVGNGWWRISISSFALCTTTACHPGIAVLSTGTSGSDGTDNNTQNGYSGIYIWGPQFESNVGSLAIRSNLVGTGSTTTNIVLDAGASSVDGTYVGNRLNISDDSNEIRNITAYVGATKTATISVAITTAPSSGVAYTIIPATMTATGFPTSYIPTPTVAVTRAADQASMTGTNFSSWYNQSQGTVLCKFDTEYTTIPSGTNGGIFVVSDNTSGNRVSLLKASGTSNITAYVETNASAQLNQILGTLTSNTFAVASVGYKYNDSYSVMNSVGFSDLSTLIPTVSNMRIGDAYPTGGWYLNGHISKLSYYPVALSSSNLVALTS